MGRLSEKSYNEVVVENSSIASIFSFMKANTTINEKIDQDSLLRKRIEEIVLEEGYFDSAKDVRNFLHDVSLITAKMVIKVESGRRDLMIIQAILTLDDLDQTFNIFTNRLREWYGYRFPEMGSIVEKSDLYVSIVASLDSNNNYRIDNVKREDLPNEKVESLMKAEENTIGADLSEEDLSEIVEFAKFLSKFYESRTRLESYLETTLRQVAPNTLTLLGPTLSARLISIAGGLNNLAKRSASTIQVLGAEKALFRSLRSGARPPKHGLIFQHKDVHQAPRWQRGKIARALAGKVAIAVRVDAYHGEYRGQLLLKEYEKRLAEIRDKYSQPRSKVQNNG